MTLDMLEVRPKVPEAYNAYKVTTENFFELIKEIENSAPNCKFKVQPLAGGRIDVTLYRGSARSWELRIGDYAVFTRYEFRFYRGYQFEKEFTVVN